MRKISHGSGASTSRAAGSLLPGSGTGWRKISHVSRGARARPAAGTDAERIGLESAFYLGRVVVWQCPGSKKSSTGPPGKSEENTGAAVAGNSPGKSGNRPTGRA